MIEKKEIEFTKEIDDVLMFVNELVRDIKAKKDLSTITTENIPNLITAIDGVSEMAEEAKHTEIVAKTVGYRSGELVGILIEKKAEA